MRIADLDQLRDWMRANGATELTVDGITLKLGPAPKPTEAADDEPVLDTTEPEDAALERKRARFERLLGRPVSLDDARDHLP